MLVTKQNKTLRSIIHTVSSIVAVKAEAVCVSRDGSEGTGIGNVLIMLLIVLEKIHVVQYQVQH